MGEAVEIVHAINGFSKNCYEEADHLSDNDSSCWYEEILDDDLKWSFALNRFR